MWGTSRRRAGPREPTNGALRVPADQAPPRLPSGPLRLAAFESSAFESSAFEPKPRPRRRCPRHPPGPGSAGRRAREGEARVTGPASPAGALLPSSLLFTPEARAGGSRRAGRVGPDVAPAGPLPFAAVARGGGPGRRPPPCAERRRARLAGSGGGLFCWSGSPAEGDLSWWVGRGGTKPKRRRQLRRLTDAKGKFGISQGDGHRPSTSRRRWSEG